MLYNTKRDEIYYLTIINLYKINNIANTKIRDSKFEIQYLKFNNLHKHVACFRIHLLIVMLKYCNLYTV